MKHLIIPIMMMASVIVVSNILVQFLVLDGLLTWGAFTYPFAFLVTDLTNRIYGPTEARKVVFGGLVVGIACSFVGTQLMGEYGPLVTMRVAVASATAFFVAQMIDVFVFDVIRSRQKKQNSWYRAPLFSTIIGSVVDTSIFFSIAFSAGTLRLLAQSDGAEWATEAAPLLTLGPEYPLWVSLAAADLLVKLVLAPALVLIYRIATPVIEDHQRI